VEHYPHQYWNLSMTETQQEPKDFVTADLHLYHQNIIKFQNRPFKSVEEMHEVMIRNHNAIVTQNDTTYYLGDVSFGDPVATVEIFNRLNGKKILVRGNHDKDQLIHALKKNDTIRIFRDYLELYHKPSKLVVVMMHYPILSWRNASHGSIHLHGHSHGGIDHLNTNERRMDVGVDSNNFTPLLIDDVVAKLQKIPKPERDRDRHTSHTPSQTEQ